MRQYDSPADPGRAAGHRAGGQATCARTRPATPTALNAAGLLQLQHAAGNTAVAWLVQRQQQRTPLLQYDLTLPEFGGITRLEQAKLNDPALKRRTDRTGPAVSAIQKALIKSGLAMPRSTKRNERPPASESPNDPSFTDRSLDPDGVWGDETSRKLRQFQHDHGLDPPDAEVGNRTLKELQDAAATPVPQPILSRGTKIAGVETFTVRYDRDDLQDGKVRIDVDAVFKDDATHDASKAEFQQFVSSRARAVGRGGGVFDTGTVNLDMHDDGYHRDPARNQNRQTYLGNTYQMTDRAGLDPIAPDDDLDFRFTAEQRIVDLARNEMVIASRGPHTVVVKGREPRRYVGAPLDL